MNDIDISGSAKISPGEYKDIHIAGAAQIEGNIKCNSLTVSGFCGSNGELNCPNGTVIVSGSLQQAQSIFTDTIKVTGSATIEKNLMAQSMTFAGSLTINGNIKGTDFLLSGLLLCMGSVEAETFETDGYFDIANMLCAEKITINLGQKQRNKRNNKIGSIGGETIIVKGKHSRVVSTLKTSVIEGDNITLECTICDVVRGKNIEIGPGCKIGRVEYSESYKRFPESEVGTEEKV